MLSFRILFHNTKRMYIQHANLVYHDFYHVLFVLRNAIKFACFEGADLSIVKPSALLHDVNYVINRKDSRVQHGNGIACKLLEQAGYNDKKISKIIKTINSSSSCCPKSENISIEAMVVSDADSAFKSLPITPILFATRYIKEVDVSIAELSKDILCKQGEVLRGGTMFYTKRAAQEYGKWEKVNVQLWENVYELYSKSKKFKDMLSAKN